jgi:hypothetical protein
MLFQQTLKGISKVTGGSKYGKMALIKRLTTGSGYLWADTFAGILRKQCFATVFFANSWN